MKYTLHFTLDYEIHGNGDGNPRDLMVEPTGRLMDLLEGYGRNVIIMADIAEILAFKRYYEETGSDDFYVTDIESQLKEAISRGHDVQLHIHSSWFKAKWDGKGWDQCMEEYNMAALPKARIDEMVGLCVEYLRNLLNPVDPNYEVWLFRAANWSMMPTGNIYQVLLKYGIEADSSVYKGGIQGGNVSYNYSEAYHRLLSYPASAEDINRLAPEHQTGVLTEYPIYTEMRPFWAFISPIRIFRMLRALFHRHKSSATEAKASPNGNDWVDNRKLSLKAFFRKNPWKLDFNQATGRQLIAASKRIKRIPVIDRDMVDVILIGHSKSFLPYNGKTLERFLKWAEKNM